MRDGDPPTFRLARDEDSAVLCALIEAVLGERPGNTLDLDAAISELQAPASLYEERDGRFWVAELDGAVVGCIGHWPTADGGAELRRLYVGREARGQGLGRQLIGIVLTEARRRSAPYVELWCDTRFESAHRLFELLGFVRSVETRTLDDRGVRIECHFRKLL